VNRLGPLEWIFNTPSHHRVHHGSNPQYIDRHYGGVLIIWDRLFGTFEAEQDTVVYGLTNNVNSFNPLTIAFHECMLLRTDNGWLYCYVTPSGSVSRPNQFQTRSRLAGSFHV